MRPNYVLAGMRRFVKRLVSLVLVNLVPRENPNFWADRACLLASRVESDYLLNRAVDFSKT